MIDAEYCQSMAAYNGWMNRKLYAGGRAVARRSAQG